MADDELREAERAWRAAPADAAAAERLVAAARRAGRPAPEAALDARVQPARTLRLLPRARVLVPRPGAWPGDPLQLVGETGRGREVRLPEHAWFVVEARGDPTSADLQLLVEECAAEGVERLRVRMVAAREPEDLARLAWPGLTHLELVGLGSFDPADQAALRAPRLVGLALDGALGGEPLDALVEAGQDLERLELRAADDLGFADPELAALGRLRRLRRLRVRQSSWDSDECQGEFLAAFQALEALALRGPELRRTALPEVARLGLLELEAWLDEGHDPSHLEPLRGLPLERLRLEGPSKTADYAELLGTLRLTHLALEHDAPAGFCARLPAGLRSLELMTGATPTWLERLPELRRLTLTLLDGSLEPLAGLAGLEALTLSGLAGAASPSLAPLHGLARLEALTLSLPDDPARLGELAALPRLARLGLGGWEWTDAHLAALAGLPRLEELTLGPCSRLGPRALEPLAGCPTLRRLHVPAGCVGITDEALRTFAGRRPEVLLLDRDGLPVG